MKKMMFISLIVFTVTNFIHGQKDNTLFQNRISMTGAWAGAGVAFTNMADQTIGQFETSLMLEYNNALVLGYEWHSNLNDNVLDDSTFKFGYSTYLIGYNYKTNQIIHPNFTIGVGPGFLNVNGDNDQIFVVQSSIGVEINLLKWARLGIEGGYRHVSKVQTRGFENSDLSNFLGSVVLRFGWSWE